MESTNSEGFGGTGPLVITNKFFSISTLDLSKFDFSDKPNDGDSFLPYKRDDKTLSRPWALPGTPGLEHRLGGIEKEENTGHVNYDPDNHHRMTELRKEKIARVASDIGKTKIN